MSVEVEAKLRVDSHDPVRARLEEAGATFVRAAEEWNCIYDSADGRLRRAGSVLRIRELEVTRGAPAASTMTYKGAVLPGTVKRRPEIEIEIGDAEAASRLVEAIGFVPMLGFQKRRESWDLLRCHVELDEVPHLGTFVEIEGPDEKTIAQAQQALGLSHLTHVKPGYVAMLSDHCRQHGLGIRDLRFEKGESS